MLIRLGRLAVTGITAALVLSACTGAPGTPASAAKSQAAGSPAASPPPEFSTPPIPTETPRPASTTFSATLAQWRLPTPVTRAVGLSSGANLLLIGGLFDSGISSAAITDINPATGQNRPLGILARGVHDAGGAHLGGRYFIFGGGGASVLDAVQSFLPGETRAAVVSRLPQLRADLSVAASGQGGPAYLVGGFDGTHPSPAVLRTTDGTTFTTLARLAQPVRYAAAAALGQQLWVFGGTVGATPTDVIQRVDTRTGAAAVVGHLPVALNEAAAVVVGGTILVLGGVVDGQPSSAIWRLDPATGHVIRAGTLPEAVAMPAAVVVDGVAYLLGGENPAALATVIEIRPTN
ncbi:hypothetical protein IV498_05025 [Paenarthrobacter sp. Z7-10]|uniref:kelch repeat-containing protein n=1 Tax=Paenarthrobacter sp. Z7-10 TaxID=2787635 RepID=UPI0022A9BD9E|nr:kelch repeat-containing protein [Paenarthrobacter sp. Z7-10]MCZ2402560.1 hypothetical protein [Paenarthrobacter sp. Z7-10]